MITFATRLSRVCPVCNSNSRPLFRKRQHWIRACHVCGHQFVERVDEQTDPNGSSRGLIHGDRSVNGVGEDPTDYEHQGPYHRARGQLYSRWVLRYGKDLPATKRVLDIGAAAGFVLQGFLDQGWQGMGIDSNPRMVDYGQRYLGLKIRLASLADFRTAEPYDLVCMTHLIEHLTELQGSLRRAADATKSNGYWLIETANRDGWIARLLGRRWRQYNPPHPLHWFSPSDLQRLVSQYGFREVVRGRSPRWINVGHAKMELRCTSRKSLWDWLAMVIVAPLPNKAAVPWLSDRFWVIYQKVW